MHFVRKSSLYIEAPTVYSWPVGSLYSYSVSNEGGQNLKNFIMQNACILSKCKLALAVRIYTLVHLLCEWHISVAE